MVAESPSEFVRRVPLLVGKYEWLLFLHVTGAFLFLGATLAALVLNVAALLRERPSEIAFLFRLVARASFAFGGLLLVLVFGLWLVPEADYDWSDGWIVWALVLFVLANALGGIGGVRARPVRALAEQLAAQGDQPSAELRRLVRAPSLMVLNFGAAALSLAILVLMIWKPGAGA
jgi:uncharacterized membrane protein